MTLLTYGPHDETTDRRTVKVRVGRGSDAEEYVVSVAAGLIEQRRRINQLAAGQARRILDRPSPEHLEEIASN